MNLLRKTCIKFCSGGTSFQQFLHVCRKEELLAKAQRLKKPFESDESEGTFYHCFAGLARHMGTVPSPLPDISIRDDVPLAEFVTEHFTRYGDAVAMVRGPKHQSLFSTLDQRVHEQALCLDTVMLRKLAKRKGSLFYSILVYMVRGHTYMYPSVLNARERVPHP